jgi:hypothetical protein
MNIDKGRGVKLWNLAHSFIQEASAICLWQGYITKQNDAKYKNLQTSSEIEQTDPFLGGGGEKLTLPNAKLK